MERWDLYVEMINFYKDVGCKCIYRIEFVIINRKKIFLVIVLINSICN